MIADLEVDVVGLKCPLPVLKLKKRIESLNHGQLVKLVTSDSTTIKDVPAFCGLSGHEIVEMSTIKRPYIFWIRICNLGINQLSV